MFPKKKAQKIDLSNAQIVALQCFFKVYEVLHGYEFSAPEKHETKEGVKLISHEPEFNKVDVWPTLFSAILLNDAAVFVFEFRGARYQVTIKHHWKWYPECCEITGPDFIASAKFGYCGIIEHDGVVISFEEVATVAKWHIEGTSAKHRLKVTPDERDSATYGPHAQQEVQRLKKRHKI